LSKYPPAFVEKVRQWYGAEGKSDSEVVRLAAGLTPPVILSRNASIGLRMRADPPIMRNPLDAFRAQREHGIRSANARWHGDANRDRETKPAPAPVRQRPEPIRKPANVPYQTPKPPTPYRTKGGLEALSGPTLVELESGQCRNPVGPEPDRPARQMFCGERVAFLERKGETVLDVYCARCAARNRVSSSSASTFVKRARAFA
jgi:hypothetical protein